jgi:hypothetical protein
MDKPEAGKFGHILESLPPFDGSARRRFIAGGIVLLGFIASQHHLFSEALQQPGTKEILSNTIGTWRSEGDCVVEGYTWLYSMRPKKD